MTMDIDRRWVSMTAAFPRSSHSHGAPRGCGRDDCDVTQIAEVDVLCRTHGALLVLSRIPPRSRYILGFVVCVVSAAAFFIAPILDNPLPIFLVLGGVGLALIGLPLRMFPVAGRSMVAGWVVACLLAFVLSRPHNGAFQLVLTVITLAVALGWALRLGRSAIEINKLADSAGGVVGAALIATCLGVAGLAGVLWLATASSGDATNARLPHGLSTPLAWIGWLTVIFVAMALGGFAAIRSTARWSGRESRLIKLPRRPKKLASWGNHGQSGRGRSAMDRLLDGLSHTLAQLVFSVADLLVYLLYYWTLRIGVAIANWLVLWFAAIRDIAMRAVKLLFGAAWNATRVILVPAVSLLVAAVLVLLFARAEVDYATAGRLADIGPLVGYAVAAYCLLTLAWTAVSALPPHRFANAVADVTAHSFAIALVGILIGGWLFGILGAFGYGTYHIRFVTITCTVLVALLMTVRGLRERFRSASLGDPIHPVVPAPRHSAAGQTTSSVVYTQPASSTRVEPGGDPL